MDGDGSMEKAVQEGLKICIFKKHISGVQPIHSRDILEVICDGAVNPPLISILFDVRCSILPLTVAETIIVIYIQFSFTDLYTYH